MNQLEPIKIHSRMGGRCNQILGNGMVFVGFPSNITSSKRERGDDSANEAQT